MRRLLLVLGLLAVLAAPAAASTRLDIYKDCEPDGRLDGTYTADDIRDAREHMPSDLAEYSDCIDALRRAELAAERPDPPSTSGVPPTAGGGTGGPGGGPSAPPQPELEPVTQEDRDALAGALDGPDAPPQVTGVEGTDDLTPVHDDFELNSLPAPLVAALVLLALAALALCLQPLRRRGLPLPRGR